MGKHFRKISHLKYMGYGNDHQHDSGLPGI